MGQSGESGGFSVQLQPCNKGWQSAGLPITEHPRVHVLSG